MQPGYATLRRLDDGTVVVEYAAAMLLVCNELLDQLVEQGPPAVGEGPAYDPQSGVMVLDTAGSYRYRYVGRSHDHPQCSIFECICCPHAKTGAIDGNCVSHPAV